MQNIGGCRSPPVIGLPLAINTTNFPPLPNSNITSDINNKPKLSFIDIMRQGDCLRTNVEAVPCKPVQIVDGIPRIKWTEEEVKRMNIMENLEYAVVGKFSYGWPDLETLRKSIPSQCSIKGECSIGLFRNHHVLLGYH
ncbi:hypothetical protein KY284_010496 [Solanum tuberosum]|nr:hypothetical protein KY284_010496 [Solanum tuberosum]